MWVALYIVAHYKVYPHLSEIPVNQTFNLKYTHSDKGFDTVLPLLFTFFNLDVNYPQTKQFI